MFRRFLSNITWLITALGSIHLGLKALGYDLFTHAWFIGWEMPVYYIIGAAGLFSLFMYVSALTCSCCSSCDKSDSCSCS